MTAMRVSLLLLRKGLCALLCTIAQHPGCRYCSLRVKTMTGHREQVS